nr:hypothetical protein GCM10020092_056990 [Actinoplanes digitatis]
MTLRVLIADDQELIRAGFRVLIDSAADMSTAGEAQDGAAAVAAAARLRPDVVLMDIQMPTMDGIEATRRICAEPELAAVRVLILTTFGYDEYVFNALRARRERLPAQGHPPGRPAGRGAHRRGGREPAVAAGDEHAHREVRDRAERRAARPWRNWTSSPTASARC